MSDRSDQENSAPAQVGSEAGGSPGWGELRTKTVSWHDPTVNLDGLSRMTGLEHVRAVQRGLLPPPPFASAVPMRLTAVEEREVRLTAIPDDSHLNVVGAVHGGVLCTLMDIAMGMAVRTTHGPGVIAVTAEMKVSFLQPIPHDGREVTVIGTVLRAGRRMSFAEAHAYDPDGTRVGHGTSSLATVPARTR